MRKTFFILVFVLTVVVYVGYFNSDTVRNTISLLRNSTIYIERGDEVKFIQDWSTENILAKVNAYRESNGLSRLSANESLDRAARARMSVISSEEDYDGSVTGVSREAAVGDSGYSFTLLGEIVTLDLFKTNNPVDLWVDDESTKKTLDEIDFKDIGVAIKNTNERVSVLVLLGSPKKVVKQASKPRITWGGPELWAVVNKRRVESGVNPLRQKDELCTLASIRLNQLLELGKLDGHAGFVPLLERSDLKWISEKYNVSEYLVYGYNTPEESVSGWENTLGHKSLITGGEYVWGCVYAQNSYGVAIAAY